MGVWIEIESFFAIPILLRSSLPSWECGLKSKIGKELINPIQVAPFVGVWIEIVMYGFTSRHSVVAPFVGVWIEISSEIQHYLTQWVAPFVGVWIEISIINPNAG